MIIDTSRDVSGIPGIILDDVLVAGHVEALHPRIGLIKMVLSIIDSI